VGEKLTIVCYDIASNKLRLKLCKTLKDFGQRLQFSVFLCRLEDEGVEYMRDRLLYVLKRFHDEHEPDDSVIIFRQFSYESADCLIGEWIPKPIQVFGIF